MDRGPQRQQGMLQRQLSRLDLSGILLHLLIGITLAIVYLNHIVPAVTIVPVKYGTPNFQNRNATYYDVLCVPVDANEAEISESYVVQMTKLKYSGDNNTHPSTWGRVLNLTTQYKVAEVEQAYNMLTGSTRCDYDFEVLRLGAFRYFYCLGANYLNEKD